MNWLCRSTDCFSQAQYEAAYAQLSPSRKTRIDRLHRATDKRRSLAGEILAKELAAQFGVCSPIIEATEAGQPVFQNCDLFLSIAHCKNQVACVVDTQPVGIDIEFLHPFRPGLLRHVCTQEEAEFVLNGYDAGEYEVTDPAVISRFFEIWTAKEAWFKMVGTGITNLRSVDVLSARRQIFRQDGYMIQIIKGSR